MSETEQHTEDRTQQPPLRIILASGSPRRRQLLEDAGVTFTVLVAEVDENLEPDLEANPFEAVKKLAERKAGAVVQHLLADPQLAAGIYAVIGADTMVVVNGEVFGKPVSASHARHMLRAMSGVTQEVMTGVSLWMISVNDEGEVSLGFRSFTDVGRVTFRELSDDEITEYLKQGESFDKAGAYAIQGKGAELVAHVDGEMDNIIGLPVAHLLRDYPELLG